jgi:predicted ArsR family transcriptional regulator
LSEVEVFKALASESRWDILKILLEKALSVNELSDKLALKPITVRHHLQSLVHVGLVEAFENIDGSQGRPSYRYRVTKKSTILSFPKREYLLLLTLIFQGLGSALGFDEAKRLLYQMGENMGKEIVRQLETENGIADWTPEVFNEVFVKGYLMVSQTYPETLNINQNEISFRTRNCLFYEVAKENPELVCNGLDSGFHDGVINSLGVGVTGERTHCMGHDDDSCDYVISWP